MVLVACRGARSPKPKQGKAEGEAGEDRANHSERRVAKRRSLRSLGAELRVEVMRYPPLDAVQACHSALIERSASSTS